MNITRTKQIKDSEGKSHKYETVLLSPSDGGFEILETVLYIMFDSGGKAINGLVEAFKGQGIDDIMKLDINLASLDIEKLGLAGMSLIDRIRAAGGVDFVKKILSRTDRDGQKIDDGVFEVAYAGNYSEMLEALWFVIAENYGKSITYFFGKFAAGLNTNLTAK